MTEIEEAWHSNAAINDVLLAHLTPAMLTAVTPGAGYTVAQHLAHMVECIKSWASKLEESSRLQNLPDLYSNYDPQTGSFDAELDLERIKAVMIQTRNAVLGTALSAKDRGELPHASVGKFLIHMMAHDAHHRGQILLALKTNAHALPDEESMWLPWRS